MSVTEFDRVIRLLRPTSADGRGVAGLALFGAALALGFSILMPDRFPSLGTLQSMLFQMPELGLLALAMVVPLISGGINLSIIATANQSALLMAFIMTSTNPPGTDGLTMTLIILGALMAGCLHCLLVGAITGFLVATMGVHPILVTLGTMSVVNGLSIYLTHGTVIAGFPDSVQWLGNGLVLGLPVPFLVFAAVAAVVGVILKRTPFGIAVFMIGSNEQATRFSGINTKHVLIGVYTLSSLLCFAAACLMMARFNSASAGYAQSYLLITILAAVLGGVDPFGGFGRIGGLVAGLAVLQILSSGLNQFGLSDHMTLAIWGLTLIAVMAVRQLLARRRT